MCIIEQSRLSYLTKEYLISYILPRCTLISLEPLQVRRRSQRLAFIYKILYGEVEVPMMAEVDFKRSYRPSRGIDTNRTK